MPRLTKGTMLEVLGCHAHPLESAPAIVTRPWSDRDPAEGPVAANLTVFPSAAAPEFHTSVMVFLSEERARGYKLDNDNLVVAFVPAKAA